MSVISDFYLARAAESAREAEATQLANVRVRCLRAEEAWRTMAARLLRSERLQTADADSRKGNG